MWWLKCTADAKQFITGVRLLLVSQMINENVASICSIKSVSSAMTVMYVSMQVSQYTLLRYFNIKHIHNDQKHYYTQHNNWQQNKIMTKIMVSRTEAACYAQLLVVALGGLVVVCLLLDP
jgi:hypothetical protein